MDSSLATLLPRLLPLRPLPLPLVAVAVRQDVVGLLVAVECRRVRLYLLSRKRSEVMPNASNATESDVGTENPLQQ